MIKDIRLKNFKVFKDVHIRLAQLNLLTGINGRGKSTLIQSLLLCKQTSEKGKLENVLELNKPFVELGTADDIRHKGSSRSSDIIIGFSYETDTITKLTYTIKESEKEGEEEVAVITKARLNDTDFGYDSFKQRQTMSTLEALPQFDPIPFKRIAFVPADRIGPKPSYEVGERNDYISFGEQARFAVSTLANRKLESVHKALVLGTTTSNTLDTQVGLWLGDILMSPFNSLKIDDENPHVISLFFQVSGNNAYQFTPPNMGFAFSYLLPIIVAGLLAKTGDTLIIENPEAHLHSKAQARLTKFLVKVANTGVQVVLESHSEHILNGLRIAAKEGTIEHKNINILYFKDNTEEPFMQLPIDRNGDIDVWPEGFFDQYDEDLQTLLGF